MPRLLLLYSSNTGNTQFAAETIEQRFGSRGLTLIMSNVSQARPEDVLGRDLLILGAPTWENRSDGKTKPGQLQDQMAAFLKQIKSLKLRDTPIAVFGLGDSRYQYFCGAAVVLKKFVVESGATLLSSPLYIDGNPEDQISNITEWADEIIAAWQQRK